MFDYSSNSPPRWISSLLLDFIGRMLYCDINYEDRERMKGKRETIKRIRNRDVCLNRIKFSRVYICSALQNLKEGDCFHLTSPSPLRISFLSPAFLVFGSWMVPTFAFAFAYLMALSYIVIAR